MNPIASLQNLICMSNGPTSKILIKTSQNFHENSHDMNGK